MIELSYSRAVDAADAIRRAEGEGARGAEEEGGHFDFVGAGILGG